MQGVAEEEVVAGVRQPVIVAAMPMVENAASKERSFCMHMFLKVIERNGGLC